MLSIVLFASYKSNYMQGVIHICNLNMYMYSKTCTGIFREKLSSNKDTMRKLTHDDIFNKVPPL